MRYRGEHFYKILQNFPLCCSRNWFSLLGAKWAEGRRMLSHHSVDSKKMHWVSHQPRAPVQRCMRRTEHCSFDWKDIYDVAANPVQRRRNSVSGCNRMRSIVLAAFPWLNTACYDQLRGLFSVTLLIRCSVICDAVMIMHQILFFRLVSVSKSNEIKIMSFMWR